MIIKGLQKLTLLDFPGKVACTLFTYGCNFRCPFCHNASLVTAAIDSTDTVKEEDFFAFLESRRGMLEGVCISGGEPTLQKDLGEFIKRIRSMGFAVKLDTNGYRPEVLRELISDGLLDYVAMDIKNSPSSYARTVGIDDFDMSKINESVEILKTSGVPFEFRTTVVNELHTDMDMIEIGQWIGEVDRYLLQDFKDSGDLIFDGLHGYDKKDLSYLLNLLNVYIPSAKIRG
ncbi:MAG: anaerobic ribonucleoside-triphosphate reductase activating protein [Clostridia bacterium]|nr:anaerobic ribonucleoside-triphosphate reductase activating protein [Clostridia bacterium]